MATIETWAWSDVRIDGRVDGGHRNQVWSGRAPTGRVAIRQSRRSAESLDWELELLADLHADGFLVALPLLTDDGRRSANGVVVQQWIEGRTPSSDEDWGLVADELRRLHARFATRRQRPGCRTVLELDCTSKSVDADLTALPDDAATELLAVFASMSDVLTSVVHGDPGPSNLRITANGRVGLLDWDESRVDVVSLDFADLGVQILDDEEHKRAVRCADAWEAANAWTTEPNYARHRLARLRMT